MTLAQLLRIFPHLCRREAQWYLNPLCAAMTRHGIGGHNARIAAFLAQIGYESGQLRFWEEIWGPTPAQLRYEGRVDLGNCEAGDGERFKGRGPTMLTGRGNYRRYGRELGVDLEGHPELAARPEYGFQVAALYWREHGCNELADAGDFEGITRKINGGLNGHADRVKLWSRAKKVLGVRA